MTPPIQEPNEGLNAAVAAEIRGELGRRKLSVRELAERSGIKYGTLRRYVAAERHIDVAVLMELARALEVDVADVVRDAERKVDFIWQREGEPPVVVEIKSGAKTKPGDLSSMEGADEAAREEDEQKPQLGDA